MYKLFHNDLYTFYNFDIITINRMKDTREFRNEIVRPS